MDMRKKEERDKLRWTLAQYKPFTTDTMLQLLDIADEMEKVILNIQEKNEQLMESIMTLHKDAHRYSVIRDWGASFMDDFEVEHNVCMWAMDEAIDKGQS